MQGKRSEGKARPTNAKALGATKDASIKGKPGRSFNGLAFQRDMDLAVDTIAQAICEDIKRRLESRVTSAEAESIGKAGARTAVANLLMNHKVMRHVADARTSQEKRMLREGATKPSNPAKQRAIQLLKNGVLGKNVADKLVAEGLAKIDERTGEIAFLESGDRYSPAGFEGNLSKWKREERIGLRLSRRGKQIAE